MKKLFLLVLLIPIALYFVSNNSLHVTSFNYNPKSHKDVFEAKCIKCHSYLKESDEYLTSMGYLRPGSPEKSMIYRYLKGANVGGPESMPPKHSFNNDELNLIKNWILNIRKVKNSNILVDSHINSKNPLSNIQLLNRCAIQFTNLPIHHVDKKLLEEVKSKTLTGEQACMVVLSKASLNENGILNNPSDIGINILTNFQKIHNNWFNEWNFFTSMSTWGTFEVLDPGSMGFFFTRSLFDNDFQLKNIFKGNDAFEGVRSSKYKQEYLQYKFKEESRYKVSEYRFIYGLSNKEGEYKQWNPKRVNSGRLMGVSKVPINRDVLPIMVNSKDNQEEIRPAQEIRINKDIHRGLGGGILGSENYVNLNLGQELGTSMDGGRIIPRRWSSAIVKELLCRDLPVVSIDIARKYVQPKSSLSFRKKASCMACHSTMDNMSYLVRNVEQGYSADAGGDGMIHSTHLRVYNADSALAPEAFAPDKDSKFHLRPASGRFVYRDVYGKDFDIKVESLDALGELIGELDDFYLCTAKKYLNFLTGTNIDMSIFSSNNLSKKERYYKSLLEKTAQKMKSTGKLRNGIENLVKSEVYKSRSFEVNID